MSPKTLLAVTALGVVSAMACTNSESSRPKFLVEFQVLNDDGDGLAGVSINVGKKRVGTTGATGTIRTELSGFDGETLPLSVTCPEGFANPETLTPLKLAQTRRVNLGGYQPLHVNAVCPRNIRNIVLAVRAHGGAHLPLEVDGTPAGETDADGIAHLLVKADRAVTSVKLAFDTGAHPELKPKNPSRTFDLEGRDAILIVEQTFVASSKHVFRGRTSRPKKHIPYRVD